MQEFPKVEVEEGKIKITRRNGSRIITKERAEKRLQRLKEIAAKFEAALHE